LRTLDEIRKAIEDVEKQPGLIVYDLVDPDHATGRESGYSRP
jgi:hypothetical protein